MDIRRRGLSCLAHRTTPNLRPAPYDGGNLKAVATRDKRRLRSRLPWSRLLILMKLTLVTSTVG